MDLAGGTITIRSLKIRREAMGRAKVAIRSVPVPPDYLDTLNTAHGVREVQRPRNAADAPIWPIGRVRVWQIVKAIMIEAGNPDSLAAQPQGTAPRFRD